MVLLKSRTTIVLIFFYNYQMLIYVYVYASYSYINHTIDMYASTIFHAKEGKRIQRILSHCRFETSADFSIHSKYLWKNEVPLKVPSSGNV